MPASVYEVNAISRNRFGWSDNSHTIRFATSGESKLNVSAMQLKKINCRKKWNPISLFALRVFKWVFLVCSWASQLFNWKYWRRYSWWRRRAKLLWWLQFSKSCSRFHARYYRNDGLWLLICTETGSKISANTFVNFHIYSICKVITRSKININKISLSCMAFLLI